MAQTIKQARQEVLKAFTIGDLDNPVTFQSIKEKLESLDYLCSAGFKVC